MAIPVGTGGNRMDNKIDWKSFANKLLNGAAISTLFNIFKGRCTFFAILFSIIGCYGWLVLGRDLTSFALFAGAIQSLLVIHSAKEDWFARSNPQAPNDQQ
jgi:hypothetical protein